MFKDKKVGSTTDQGIFRVKGDVKLMKWTNITLENVDLTKVIFIWIKENIVEEMTINNLMVKNSTFNAAKLVKTNTIWNL